MRFGSIPKRVPGAHVPSSIRVLPRRQSSISSYEYLGSDGRPNVLYRQTGVTGCQARLVFFPEVQGGKGKANDIFGSVYGWLASKDAPKEAIDLMKVCLRKEIQTKLAAMGLSIPMVKGTAEAIQNPFFKALAVEVDHSDWICVAMDQLLGHDTGRVFNDEAAAVAAGAKSPDDAVKAVEKSWSKNRI